MTEKNYNPNQKEKKAMKKQLKIEETKNQKIEAHAPEKKLKEEKNEIIEENQKKENFEKEKTEKKPSQKNKKEFVVVNVKSVPISTKYAVSICRLIKGKRIKEARKKLEEVAKLNQHVPMKGEYPHRKGAGKIASGRGKFPVKASKYFITLLKSLAGNATNHDIIDPIISEAIANKAYSPVGRYGAWKRKRTHVKLVAVEFKQKEKTN